jgi:hypothetical protein
MNELDHLHVELVGRNLIEASAGTGKTYAIACLYLRLLVENNLMPEQILYGGGNRGIARTLAFSVKVFYPLLAVSILVAPLLEKHLKFK